MALPLEDVALITAKTLENYNARAASFCHGTRDHDATQNIGALLRHATRRRCAGTQDRGRLESISTSSIGGQE